MNTLGNLLCVHQAGNFAVCLEDFKYTEGKPRCVSYCRFNFFSGDSLRYYWLSAVFEIHRDKIPALFAHCFLCRSKNSWNWKCYKTFFYQIFYRLLPIKWIFYIFQCFTATYLKQSLETQTWWRTSLNHTLEFISSDCWAATRRRGVVFTLERKKKLTSMKLPNILSHGKRVKSPGILNKLFNLLEAERIIEATTNLLSSWWTLLLMAMNTTSEERR